MKNTFFIWTICIILSPHLWRGVGGDAYAQFTGGNADGHYLVSKLDIVSCAALPMYSNISTGGNADGHYLVSKLDIVSCAALPMYSNISTGGNADGHSLCADGGCYVILPIELLYFNATLLSDNTVICQWATATEINNDYFIIERNITQDTLTFEQIGKADGAGNSSQTLRYAFYDEHPYFGLSYYRLKQVDFNGDYSYSEIRAVNRDEFDIINISPNPVEKEVKVLLYSNKNTKVNVNIYNILGQNVKTSNCLSSLSVSKGTNEIKIDVSTFSTGYYLLEVETETGLYRVQRKLIKN